MSRVLLRAEDLVLAYGTSLVAGPLSFEVTGGECLWVRGANGAGKTGLLRVLCGIDGLARGGIYLDGCLGDEAMLRASAFFVGGCEGLDSLMSLMGIARYESALLGIEVPSRAVWSRYGLWGVRDFELGRLSSGQQKRLLMMLRMRGVIEAGTLIKRVCCLDEPENALDDDGKRLVYEEVEVFLKRGGVVLIAGHSRPSVEHRALFI